MYESEENPNDKDLILIEENSQIEGAVLCLAGQGSVNNRLLKIDKTASIRGQLYGDCLTELKGDIEGNVYITKLRQATSTSVNDHTMSEIVIRGETKPDAFVSILPWSESTRKEIVKWLF